MLLIQISLLVLLSGLLVMLVPDRLWKRIFKTGRLKNKMSSGSLLLFSGLFALGLELMYLNLAEAYAGWESTRWPGVEATVVSSEIVQTSQPRSTGAAWVPEIRYTYSVHGAQYTGRGIRYGSMESTDRAWVEQQVKERFPAGRSLVIFYDPDEPSRAVVETGFETFLFAYVLLGFVFAFVGGYYVRELITDWEGDGKGRVA